MAKTHFVVIPDGDFCQTEFWFLVFGKQYSVCYAGASFGHDENR